MHRMSLMISWRQRGWRPVGFALVVVAALGQAATVVRAQPQAPAAPVAPRPAPQPSSRANVPTFARDVAPILQAKCQPCHRSGYSAPMALEDYDQIRPWARAIRARVVDRQMPPWHIDRSVGVQAFKNDRSLTDAEIATISQWAAGGAPRGDLNDLPPPRVFANDDDWNYAAQFGPPDLVLKSQPFTMAAQGPDMWWRPITSTGLTEDRWVRAIEIKPSTPEGRQVTHRALVRLKQVEGDGAEFDAEPGFLAEWVLGTAGEILPVDTGRLMKAGSKIVWDVHYHAVGEAVTDQMRIGIYFYPKGQVPKFRQSLEVVSAVEGGAREMDLPPNSTLMTQGSQVLPRAGRLEAFSPHMHWRGTAMLLEATLPDGRTQVLNHVRNFNFAWQMNYVYADHAAPLLPKGTRLRVTAWYDNTANNRANPDATQWVGWGERAVDEVGQAWLTMTYLSDADFEAASKQRAAAAPNP